MKVLSVYPQFPDSFRSFKHALRFIRRKSAYPPLGLLTMKAMLLRDWSNRLFDDLNVVKFTQENLARADCAFVNAIAV